MPKGLVFFTAMFAIWLLLTAEDEDHIVKIIKNLSKTYEAPEFQPHITIYGIVDAKLDAVKEAVTKSIVDIKPFIAKTDGLSYSDDIWKSVFVNIKSNKNLNLIYERLNQMIGRYGSYELIPHISLIYKKLNKLNKKKIVEGIKIKEEVGIDRMSILRFSEDVSKWKIVKSFKL